MLPLFKPIIGATTGGLPLPKSGNLPKGNRPVLTALILTVLILTALILTALILTALILTALILTALILTDGSIPLLPMDSRDDYPTVKNFVGWA
jgi:hypothetical protein